MKKIAFPKHEFVAEIAQLTLNCASTVSPDRLALIIR